MERHIDDLTIEELAQALEDGTTIITDDSTKAMIERDFYRFQLAHRLNLEKRGFVYNEQTNRFEKGDTN